MIGLFIIRGGPFKETIIYPVAVTATDTSPGTLTDPEVVPREVPRPTTKVAALWVSYRLMRPDP